MNKMTKNEYVKRQIELEDELHYLQNLMEYADEEGKDLETVIQDKIEWLYNELDSMAINKF